MDSAIDCSHTFCSSQFGMGEGGGVCKYVAGPPCVVALGATHPTGHNCYAVGDGDEPRCKKPWPN